VGSTPSAATIFLTLHIQERPHRALFFVRENLFLIRYPDSIPEIFYV
jgi:hypothetical protein